jgi:hypothetical protein
MRAAHSSQVFCRSTASLRSIVTSRTSSIFKRRTSSIRTSASKRSIEDPSERLNDWPSPETIARASRTMSTSVTISRR